MSVLATLQFYFTVAVILLQENGPQKLNVNIHLDLTQKMKTALLLCLMTSETESKLNTL